MNKSILLNVDIIFSLFADVGIVFSSDFVVDPGLIQRKQKFMTFYELF